MWFRDERTELFARAMGHKIALKKQQDNRLWKNSVRYAFQSGLYAFGRCKIVSRGFKTT